MKNKRPTWKEIIAFAVGDGGCNLVWTTIGSYLTLYYTDSVGLAAATIGTMMLLTRLLDGISDLIMGSIIGRTHTRWGKARPWILISAPAILKNSISYGHWTCAHVQHTERAE